MLGVASLVLLGIHTAVIMVLPALAGAGAALAYHHSPAGAAKEFRSQKIIVLGLVTGRGFPVRLKPLLYPEFIQKQCDYLGDTIPTWEAPNENC